MGLFQAILDFIKRLFVSQKRIELRVFEKGAARRAASQVVSEKNKITDDYEKFVKLVGQHKISQVRESVEEIKKIVDAGLRNSNKVISDSLMLARTGAEKTRHIAEKYGSELNHEKIQYLKKETKETYDTLAEFKFYIDELKEAIQGRETATGALSIAAAGYKITGWFSPFRRFSEWLSERGAMNEEFSAEKKIEKYEHKKHLKPEEVKIMLTSEKKFAEDFRKIMKEMCIFTLILIRTAHKTADEITDAASEKRYDLPQAMKVYSSGITDILNQEFDNIRTWNQLRLESEESCRAVMSALEKADARSTQTERKMKLAHAGARI